MLTLLPIIAFVLTITFLYRIRASSDSSFREIILIASIAWGIFVALTVEVLNLFNAVSLPWIALAWVMAILFLVVLLTYRPPILLHKSHQLKFSKEQRILISVLFSFLFVEALIALIAPPNTWDSMTYHMSRVAHWLQNRSISFYSTHISRQNYLTPWAEHAILHLQILFSSDRLANLIQWYSMFGCVIGVTLIAKEFGADRKTQLYSAVFAVTIPMAIVQASSTQNDLVVSFWIVCFVYFGLRYLQSPNLMYILATGCSLSLALNTKSTAFIFLFPFMIWWGIEWLRANTTDLSSFLKGIMIVAFVVMLLNLPHFLRNNRTYGNPLGSDAVVTYSNQKLSGPIFLSNVIRNLALHTAIPVPQVNQAIQGVIEGFLGSEANNPDSTWPGTTFNIRYKLHEDAVGSGVHIMFIIFSFLFLFRKKRLDYSLNPRIYAIGIICAFLLFSAYLRWQPWHVRLHLPLLILAAPLAITVLSRNISKKSMSILVLALIVVGFPALFYNRARPIIRPPLLLTTNRIDQYFINRPELRDPYLEASTFIVENCVTDIGLIMGGDDWEYPIWALFDSMSWKARIEHVAVNDNSAVLESLDFEPKIIWATEILKNPIVHGKKYTRVWSEQNVILYAVQDANLGDCE